MTARKPGKSISNWRLWIIGLTSWVWASVFHAFGILWFASILFIVATIAGVGFAIQEFLRVRALAEEAAA